MTKEFKINLKVYTIIHTLSVFWNIAWEKVINSCEAPRSHLFWKQHPHDIEFMFSDTLDSVHAYSGLMHRTTGSHATITKKKGGAPLGDILNTVWKKDYILVLAYFKNTVISPCVSSLVGREKYTVISTSNLSLFSNNLSITQL